MANPDSNARKTYRELPPGVFVRKRRRQDYFFCYVGHGESRKEVSLGLVYGHLRLGGHIKNLTSHR